MWMMKLMVNDSLVSGFDYAPGSAFQLWNIQRIRFHTTTERTSPGVTTETCETSFLSSAVGIFNWIRHEVSLVAHRFKHRTHSGARNLIPFKGQVLNMISEWAFSQTKEGTKVVKFVKTYALLRLRLPDLVDWHMLGHKICVGIFSRRNSLSTLHRKITPRKKTKKLCFSGRSGHYPQRSDWERWCKRVLVAMLGVWLLFLDL